MYNLFIYSIFKSVYVFESYNNNINNNLMLENKINSFYLK